MSEITLKSDVTGRVWQVLKVPGDPVAEDETIMVIEAMKMEIPIVSEHAGRILSVLVAQGDEVSEDQQIAILERNP